MYFKSNIDYTQEEIQEQEDKILEFFKELNPYVYSRSTTNGLSLYVEFENEGVIVKVRFSDHASNDSNKDYVNGEINESTYNRIGYLLGLPGFSYGPTRLKIQYIESRELPEGKELISYRYTKNGNIQYTYAQIKAYYFLYIKK